MGWIGDRLAARHRRQADEAIRRLREDVEVLGIGPVPGPVRVALRQYHQRQVRTWVLWAVFAYFCLRGIAGTLAGDVERLDELAERVPYYSDSKVLVEWAIGDIGAGGVALLLAAYPLRFAAGLPRRL
jgi:hypothetical protein